LKLAVLARTGYELLGNGFLKKIMRIEWTEIFDYNGGIT